MAFANDIILTYDEGNRIPDVQAAIINLTPVETPLYAGLRKTQADDVVHAWQEETLDVAQDNAVTEGAEFGTETHTQPTRVDNITQLFERVFNVSSSSKFAKKYGIKNQYLRQEMLNSKKINTDIELALLRGSKNSGTGSAARRMQGMINFLSTNKTLVSSGTKLTESFFNGMLQLVYDAGGDVDEIYTNSFLKRVISGYTAGSVKDIPAESKRAINTISVYESDFGMQRIFIHRYMPKTSNSDSGVLFIDRMSNAVAIGNPVVPLARDEVAQTGHGRKGVIAGELTLQVEAQSHQAYAGGFLNEFN